MLESALREAAGTVLLEVLVTPGAARTRAMGIDPWRHALRIRVAARAESGEANDALVRFLADALAIPRSSVRIASGATSRRKTIALAGIDRTEVERRLSGGF
jgi:hypothetical protein